MRDVGIAYVLWFFFGVLGVHRFYCGRVGSGVLWLLTGGLLGIGWLVDVFLVPQMVRDCNAERFAYGRASGFLPAGMAAYPGHVAVPAAAAANPGPQERGAVPHRVVFCTRCGGAMQVPVGAVGSSYACPTCGTVLRIPAA